MAIWTQSSGTTLRTLQEQVTTTVDLPVIEGATITLISGELPSGMRLEGTSIVGTPFEVSRETTYRFVLRALLNGDIADRTFNIIVQGEDDPIWITNQGLLPIGANNTLYILDNSPIEFQLQAIDNDTSAGQELSYFIANGDGILPPGIQLTQDGRLIGVVDPILALEKAALDGDGTYDSINFDKFPFDFTNPSGQGFDSFFYDVTRYDIADATRAPRKLNRYYQFRVSVSDGDTIAQRDFRIFVVGDDFLRADNTIMQVGTGTFTADNTNIRTPIWITPANLGVRRSNNYVTLFLDVIDPNSLTGIVVYSLESINPDDGSTSELPPGLLLDGTSGEVAGRVPYQPRVTETYKFSIKATRQTSGESETAESIKTFTLTLLGEVDSTITWQTPQDLGDISANYVSTLNVVATSNVPNSKIIYTLDSGKLPSGLSLGLDGEIIGKINPYANNDGAGLTVFDNANLQFDANTTTLDRDFVFTVRARDQFGFSAITRKFTITVADPDKKLYSNIFMRPLLKQAQRNSFVSLLSDPDIFNPDLIYRANDPRFGVQKQPQLLVYAGIETTQVNQYVAAIANSMSRKKLKFGELKIAQAKTPGTNDVVYELIYFDMIDPYEGTGDTQRRITINNDKKILVNILSATPADPQYDNQAKFKLSIPTRIYPLNFVYVQDVLYIYTRDGLQEYDFTDDIIVQGRDGTFVVDVEKQSQTNINFRPVPENVIKADTNLIKVSDPNDRIRYISTISHVRDELRSLGRTENNFLPLWMRTAQQGGVQELGYTLAIPLCYCKPGGAEIIKAAIEFNEFDFTQFDIDIDRFVIDTTEGNSNEQYILFANRQFNL